MVRKPICQRDVRAQASGSQRRLQRYGRASASRAQVHNLARPGGPQSVRQYRDNRSMQPQSRLNEAKVIGGRIAHDVGEPGLVLEFEEMETGKDHGASVGIYLP